MFNKSKPVGIVAPISSSLTVNIGRPALSNPYKPKAVKPPIGANFWKALGARLSLTAFKSGLNSAGVYLSTAVSNISFINLYDSAIVFAYFVIASAISFDVGCMLSRLGDKYLS